MAHQQEEILQLVQSGKKTAADAARLFNVHPATVSRILKRSMTSLISFLFRCSPNPELAEEKTGLHRFGRMPTLSGLETGKFDFLGFTHLSCITGKANTEFLRFRQPKAAENS